MANRTGRRVSVESANTHRLAVRDEAQPPDRPAGRRHLARSPRSQRSCSIAAVAAYFTAYSSFFSYDDEGYILLSLKQFVAGQHLYSDVYSQYGPFPYELFGALFAVTGRAVSPDAARGLVIVEWLASSLLAGVCVLRVTGRLALGVAASAVAFGTLTQIVREPLHPGGLGRLRSCSRSARAPSCSRTARGCASARSAPSWRRSCSPRSTWAFSRSPPWRSRSWRPTPRSPAAGGCGTWSRPGAWRCRSSSCSRTSRARGRRTSSLSIALGTAALVVSLWPGCAALTGRVPGLGVLAAAFAGDAARRSSWRSSRPGPAPATWCAAS